MKTPIPSAESDTIMEEHDEIDRLEAALRAERLTVAIQADTIKQIRESNDALAKLCAEQTEALRDKGAEIESLHSIICYVQICGSGSTAEQIIGYLDKSMATLEAKRAALAPVNGGKA